MVQGTKGRYPDNDQLILPRNADNRFVVLTYYTQKSRR